jgi:HlyD family secretion protein
VKTWQRRLIWIVVIALIGGGAYWFFFIRGTGGSGTEPVLIRPERGTIIQELSLSGSVSLLDQINISPRVTGKVAKISVQAGDQVQKDQELLMLDTRDLDNQIALAGVSLQSARLRLQQLEEGLSATDIAPFQIALDKANSDQIATADNLSRVKQNAILSESVAQDAVNSAQRRLEEAKQNLVLSQANVEKSLEIAQTAVDNAQAEYDKAANSQLQDAAKRSLVLAEQKLEAQRIAGEQQLAAAQAQVNATGDALNQAHQALEQRQSANRDLLVVAQNQVVAADYALKAAKAQYDQRVASPSDTTLALQRTVIDQAQITLDNLTGQRSDAVLRAPIPGTVGTVNVKVGDMLAPSVPALTLVNTQALDIIASVPEVNMAQLQQGMSASIKADAFPDRIFSATLNAINPLATITAGVVNYIAHFTATGEASTLLKQGMTLDVSIVVAEASNALIIPRSSLRILQSKYNVMRWDGTALVEQVVEIGIVNDLQAEIRSGLTESDQIALSASGKSGTTALQIPGLPTTSSPSK